MPLPTDCGRDSETDVMAGDGGDRGEGEAVEVADDEVKEGDPVPPIDDKCINQSRNLTVLDRDRRYERDS